ncbi:MAG: hypothetical protein ACOYWZ_00550 [Bacillota bacterium]
MKYCPDCSSNYNESLDSCPRCSADLPPYSEGGYEGKLVHLTNVSNEIEFAMVKGLMEQAGIPLIKKSLGIDEIVGLTLEGIEVLVHEERHEEALLLINTAVDDKVLEEEERKTEHKSEESELDD